MSSKFKVGDRVRIFTHSAPDSPFHGQVGVIIENIAGGHMIDVPGLSEHFAIPERLALVEARPSQTPMLEQPRYIAGVDAARLAREQAKARNDEAIANFVAVTEHRAAPFIEAAQERAAANRSKYPEAPSTMRMIFVPRGAKPFKGDWSDEFAKLGDRQVGVWTGLRETETSDTKEGEASDGNA